LVALELPRLALPAYQWLVRNLAFHNDSQLADLQSWRGAEGDEAIEMRFQGDFSKTIKMKIKILRQVI